MTKTPHIGRNICRLRELREIKQETMAEELGISQQAVSKLEQNETIEDVTLGRIAKVLGFSPEVIRNYNDEAVINNIQNSYDSSTPLQNNGPFHNCHFNDKLEQALEENKKLVDEIKSLYVALLKEKDEKIVLLEELFRKKE
ncbi:helix-turn-helix domain-containing protein [Chryseolinea lacunae]|uniref:Helix-turn-helix transcriptional regulator n=1 Tax=Chryseolinea lacunae TaxID=2801331 RepID=A0ABS1KTE7_9BACT|nr:helix-turn-helix transcriptional regulator [Chryseolinea lacunae]MBL0742743.1 helix-turn-helix transcriptional regulator [Chryseolinea lacunae]